MILELDAGESDDETEELWRLFDLLNIACGGHAGDERSMARVIAVCAAHGIAAGAHPSYPDREGFGRRTLAIEPAVLERSITVQCRALSAIARAAGVEISHLKPHGALYHDAARDRGVADAIIRGATAGLAPHADPATDAIVRGATAGLAPHADPATDAIVRGATAGLAGLPTDAAPHTTRLLAVIGPPHGALADAAHAAGLTYLREGFADRGTRADGSLIPRGEPGALITEPAEAAARAGALAPTVDALCLHADTPGALVIARAVREAVC